MNVADLARVILPRAYLDGTLVVLTAYFDDSGTHEDSDVVLVGGVYGNAAQWAALEPQWKALLADPGKGWPALSRFHMFECEHGRGEFEGQTKGARDHLIYRFRNLILDAGLHGYAMGCSRADWEGLVVGDQLAAWGDPERWCVSNCILRTLEWAELNSVETEVAFVFDNRPQRADANLRVFSIYQHYADTERPTPKPAGMSFLNSTDAWPLQAADMYAWESRRHAQGWLAEGRKTKARAHYRPFMQTDRFAAQVADRPSIEKLVASVAPGSTEEATIAHMAGYFRASPPHPWAQTASEWRDPRGDQTPLEPLEPRRRWFQ